MAGAVGQNDPLFPGRRLLIAKSNGWLFTAVGNLSPHGPLTPPAFTCLCLSGRPFLPALPVPVLAYCVFALIRKPSTPQEGTAFIAWTMTALCLLF